MDKKKLTEEELKQVAGGAYGLVELEVGKWYHRTEDSVDMERDVTCVYRTAYYCTAVLGPCRGVFDVYNEIETASGINRVFIGSQELPTFGMH